jgi:iron complex outermembrane receptor protein
VFKPNENHGIRFSYNSAFSTPSALNYFLDVSGGVAPGGLAQLGYSTRAYGSGRDGWSLRTGGEYQMRSPCTPAGLGGPGQLVPISTQLMWQCWVGILAASGAIDAGTYGFLANLNPTSSDIATLALDPLSGAITPLALLDLPDMEPTLESNTETYEIGWTGLIKDRISVAADVYWMKKNDFVSPLLVQTPLLILNPEQIAGFLIASGIPAANAAALATGGAGIPVGVISSDTNGARGPELILGYRNVGDVEVWGWDLTMQAFLSDNWMLGASWSQMNKDQFGIGEGLAPITLNAPKSKGSVSLSYRDAARGVNLSTRVRYTSGFPAASAGFVGDVEAAAIVDMTAGYAVPNTKATLQLSVTNLFGNLAQPFDPFYQSFVGVPEMGRFTMVRVKYDLF